MTANNQKKLAEKMKEKYPVDERISASNTKALSYCGIAAICYSVIMLPYESFRRNGNPIPPMILLAVLAIIITAVKHKDRIIEKPEAAGRQLSTGTDALSLLRRLGMYLLESLLFVAGITAADLLMVKTGITPADSRVIDHPRAAVIFFVIFFLFTLILGERKAKKYNAYQAQLDNEENDLDD